MYTVLAATLTTNHNPSPPMWWLIWMGIIFIIGIIIVIRRFRRQKKIDENINMYNKILKENLKNSKKMNNDAVKAGEGTQKIKREMDEEAEREAYQQQQEMFRQQEEMNRQMEEMNRQMQEQMNQQMQDDINRMNGF